MMVRMGMAWWYRRYDKTKELENAERYAKENKVGLWADKNPIAPWDWRKVNGKALIRSGGSVYSFPPFFNPQACVVPLLCWF